MKILIRIVIASSILGVASWVIIQVPSVQDRLMLSVVSGMANSFGKLHNEDGLSEALITKISIVDNISSKFSQYVADRLFSIF